MHPEAETETQTISKYENDRTNTPEIWVRLESSDLQTLAASGVHREC